MNTEIRLSTWTLQCLLKGTQFEREIMSPGAGKRLVALGLAHRCSGRTGRLTTIALTDAGRARCQAEVETRLHVAVQGGYPAR